MRCSNCQHWHKRDIDVLTGVEHPTVGICRAPEAKMHCPDSNGEPQDIETEHDFGCVQFVLKS